MTNYSKLLADMTPEKLAQLNVHMIIVNQSQPFYMTSTGQLFDFNHLADAVKYEYTWLTKELESPTTDPSIKVETDNQDSE